MRMGAPRLVELLFVRVLCSPVAVVRGVDHPLQAGAHNVVPATSTRA